MLCGGLRSFYKKVNGSEALRDESKTHVWNRCCAGVLDPSQFSKGISKKIADFKGALNLSDVREFKHLFFWREVSDFKEV